MEAPEKIYAYIPKDDIVGTASLKKGFPHQFVKEEYTRTDALVKKFCEWLETNYTEFLDGSRLGINIEELVKDLKNDFKTE